MKMDNIYNIFKENLIKNGIKITELNKVHFWKMDTSIISMLNFFKKIQTEKKLNHFSLKKNEEISKGYIIDFNNTISDELSLKEFPKNSFGKYQQYIRMGLIFGIFKINSENSRILNFDNVNNLVNAFDINNSGYYKFEFDEDFKKCKNITSYLFSLNTIKKVKYNISLINNKKSIIMSSFLDTSLTYFVFTKFYNGDLSIKKEEFLKEISKKVNQPKRTKVDDSWFKMIKNNNPILNFFEDFFENGLDINEKKREINSIYDFKVENIEDVKKAISNKTLGKIGEKIALRLFKKYSKNESYANENITFSNRILPIIKEYENFWKGEIKHISEEEPKADHDISINNKFYFEIKTSLELQNENNIFFNLSYREFEKMKSNPNSYFILKVSNIDLNKITSNSKTYLINDDIIDSCEFQFISYNFLINELKMDEIGYRVSAKK